MRNWSRRGGSSSRRPLPESKSMRKMEAPSCFAVSGLSGGAGEAAAAPATLELRSAAAACHWLEGRGAESRDGRPAQSRFHLGAPSRIPSGRLTPGGRRLGCGGLPSPLSFPSSLPSPLLSDLIKFGLAPLSIFPFVSFVCLLSDKHGARLFPRFSVPGLSPGPPPATIRFPLRFLAFLQRFSSRLLHPTETPSLSQHLQWNHVVAEPEEGGASGSPR